MLSEITSGVWTVDSSFAAPGLRLPLRMTIFQTDGDGLLLYSPVALDAETADAIESLGEVRHIVAPSLLHHLHAGAARDRFSGATLWGPAGLKKKRPDLTALAVLPPESPFPGIDLVHIEGAPRLQEVCLRHRAGDALACADLVFNMYDIQGWFAQVFTWVTGTNRRLAMSRTWHAFARDKVRAADSIARVLDWDAQRVLMGHGDALLADGTQELRAVIFLTP